MHGGLQVVHFQEFHQALYLGREGLHSFVPDLDPSFLGREYDREKEQHRCQDSFFHGILGRL